MAQHKRFYIDVETTGVDPNKHSMHQFAGLVEIDNKIVEEVVLWLAPDGEIEPQALTAQGITIDAFNDPKYLPAEENYKKLTGIMKKYVNKFKKTDKFHVVGYNCQSFDTEFVRALFMSMGDVYYGSWFWYPSIDVMLLWSEILQRERSQLSNFKLMTLAKYLGIEVDETKAHEAMYDVTITRELYRLYKIRMNPLAKAPQKE